MDMKKISAACATAAALAALCVPGSAFAADGTLTLNAGDGSTLAGHSFTVYKVAGYNDVVKDGANVKSVSASSPDATTDAWVKAALNKNGVTYNTSEGRNAAEQLLRLKTNSDTLRKVAGTLQSTAASSKVAAVKTNQTSATGSLNLTLPEGYYMALSDYDRDWLVRYTYNSNAIEGSTLTLQDTSLVLEGEFVPSDSPARFVFAARGVADGMAYVREYASERRELDPELIQRIHEVTALDLQPFARGTFRPYGYLARITATRVKTADPLEIHDDLQALIDGLNGSDAHPLLKAAAFHTMFENIHPFMDGNGRTGRQLLNLMLLENGYRPVAIKHDAGRVYARGLESWQVDGDPEPFCSILFDCVEQEERTFIDLVERLRHDPKTTDGSIAMDAPGQDVQPPDPADVPDDARPDDPGIGLV